MHLTFYISTFRLFQLQNSKQIENNIHHIPIASIGTGFRENTVPRCVHTRRTGDAIGLERGESSGKILIYYGPKFAIFVNSVRDCMTSKAVEAFIRHNYALILLIESLANIYWPFTEIASASTDFMAGACARTQTHIHMRIHAFIYLQLKMN